MLSIIALIIGGVFVGQDLVHASLLRNQIDQIRQYETAYGAFKEKYACVPGDCKEAINYWPTGLALPPGTPSATPAILGDGYIENNMRVNYDDASVTWANSDEYQNFFIELGLAGLVADRFQATTGAPVVGTHLPALKINNTGAFFAADSRSFITTGRNPDITTYRRGKNALWFTACAVSRGGTMQLWDDGCAIFRAEDLSNIDGKIDDGLPLSGQLFGFGGYSSNNACLNNSGTAYVVSTRTPQCQAAYVLD